MTSKDSVQDVERIAQKIVDLCEHEPPERIDDPHPKLFTDLEGERIDSSLFRLWQKGLVDAEWDEEHRETKWWLTHFGAELCQKNLVRSYVVAIEGEIQIDATPAAMEVLER